MSFEGAIGEFDLVQRLVELGREHFTGAIRFEQDGIIKIVYFKGGDVLSASTNDRKDAIDEILLRAGKVSKEHVKQALAKRKDNETLGDALLNLGFITRKELTWARRVQVIGILRSVRAWTSGTWAIVPDYLPKREEGTLFPLQQIIIEFIVTEQDRQSFDRAMDGGDAVFRKGAGFDDAFRVLDLNEEAGAIAAQIDGDKTAGEIAGVTGEDTFNVYKLLEALRLLGLIEKGSATSGEPAPAQPPPAADDFGFATAGVADAADAWSSPQLETDSVPETEPMPAAVPESMMQPQFNFETAEEDSPGMDLGLPQQPEPPPAPEAPAMPLQFDEERRIPFALSHDPGSTAPVKAPEWGFDEAQIEAVHRAVEGPNEISQSKPKRTTPIVLPKTKPKKEKAGVSPVFGIVISLLLGGIIAGTYWWWRNRNATPEPKPVVTRAATTSTAARRDIMPPPDQTTPPVEPVPTTTPAVVARTAPASPSKTTQTTTARPATTSAAPAPVPAPVTQTAAKSRLERGDAGRVITNTTAAPGPGDAARGSFDEQARRHAANPRGNFTVQFELVCQAGSLSKAVEAGGSNVWFVPTTYRGQSCYRVFWGHYDTSDAARAGAQQIPASLRGSAPVVVSVPKP